MSALQRIGNLSGVYPALCPPSKVQLWNSSIMIRGTFYAKKRPETRLETSTILPALSCMKILWSWYAHIDIANVVIFRRYKVSHTHPLWNMLRYFTKGVNRKKIIIAAAAKSPYMGNNLSIILYSPHLNNTNDGAESADYQPNFIQQLSWSFASDLDLAECKNRPPPCPFPASARKTLCMIFHRFDMQNCSQKRWNMIWSAGMDSVTCKCSPWKWKDWKSRVSPPFPLI